MEKYIEEFLKKHDICRLATAGNDCMPHVVPVSYIYYDEKIYISTDFGTKKLKNIKENPKAAVVVDDVNPNKGILVWGMVKLIEKGQEYKKIYELFYKKFPWVRANPWKEGEAPFIEIEPIGSASWGLRTSL